MADILEERINIQSEETSYRAAVSEAMLTRVGASLNFINKRQYDTKAFFLNGKYYQMGTPQHAVDGAYMFLFDAEIVGCMMFNITAGSSGTTTLDIKRYTASNTGGSSIFTTPPSISFSAGNYAFVGRRLIPTDTILENPSGTTAPVIGTVNVDAGDMITLSLTSAQSGAENCGIVLFFRPR